METNAPRQPDDIPKNPIFGEYHRAGATPKWLHYVR
jgi:hypothetical protein